MERPGATTGARWHTAAQLLRRYETLVAALIAFVVLLLIALDDGVLGFPYDAFGYWSLSDSFVRDGVFSLTNFDATIRGYSLPLALYVLRDLADLVGMSDLTLPKVVNAVVFSAIATVLVPKLAMTAWPQAQWRIWHRLGLAALLAIFWRGYLSYPLTDFPALAAVLLALIAVARVDRPGWMLVAGLAGALAVNLRPSYLLLLPLLAALIAFAWWEQRRTEHASWRRRALCVGLLVVGFVAVSLPQALTSHRQFGNYSFVPGANGGLTALQFTEGLRMQRYETYLGTGQPGPRMIFFDETGSRILAEQEDGVVEDAREYLGVIVDHPIAMVGVFGRHVINGLDVRYSTPYVLELDEGANRWMRILGFVIVFLALLRVAWPKARRALAPARWRYPAALGLSGATALASAVEGRFLLPIAVLAYMVVLTPRWPNPLASGATGVRRLAFPAVALVALVVFMAIVLNVIGSATDQLVISP